MFKELGEFIDNVGRATGYAVKRLLSDEKPLEMTGYEVPDEEDFPEELRKMLGEHDAVNVIDNDNKNDV